MHNQFDRKEGRASIVPGARRSIHDYKGHSVISAMGRYGIGKNSVDLNNVSRQETGRDEVDNVLSKPASSSALKREKKKKRKQSLPSANHQVTDDSDEESDLQFSKSLPTNLPSYYSNEYENTSAGNEVNTSNQRNSTTESVSAELNNSQNNSRLNSSNYSNYSPSLPPRKLLPSASSGSKISWPIIFGSMVVILIGAGAAYYIKPVPNKVSNRSIYDEDEFYHDMTNLAKKYKGTDISISKLYSGLSSIFKNEDTGCFIFLHNSQNNGFHDFDIFVENVVTASARYLRNENDTARHILVDNLNMNTQGELINKYRHELEKNGVMLVKKLERIPSNLAMAFHYYCDEYNPLAKKSAVFFTLDLAKCSMSLDEKSNTKLRSKNEKHADVEKCLASKWDTISKDNIGPLLTRVVNVIIDLSKVF